jgi:hypothetical protein
MHAARRASRSDPGRARGDEPLPWHVPGTRRPDRFRAKSSERPSEENRSDAVPVNCPPKRTLLPRYKGIYHVGCTDYPDPTYP